MTIDRRTLLRGAAALGLSAPLLSAAATSAHAAGTIAGNYDVLLTEHVKNKVMLFRAFKEWTPANEGWSWQAPATAAWARLNDARFRRTDRHGWVCVVAAGGGRVGMVNFGDDDALLWSAAPGGNPHAVEYLGSHGAVVVASTSTATGADEYPGYVTLYAPTDADDATTLGLVQQFRFQDAHGLWWDGTHLFVLGKWTLAKYRLTGSLRTTRLALVDEHKWTYEFFGHSLDMDFTSPDRLVLTGGGAVWSVDKNTLALTEVRPASYGVKSFSRAADGESFWLQAINVKYPEYGTGGYWNNHVQFFDPALRTTETRGLVGYGYTAKFYRSRIATVLLTP
ncbi:hypothetical protein [Streptomyces omiyaensis]|uniref:Uncharacterized protein n=1 Tax=Streptomyces omiyaensis TaxID=68247 RepID=A0ABW7BL56_9ACTN|nr:hypothetical protein [Streptomyces omiyaensis]GGY24798.1 hypothetical protein GCM10010363_01140 [Streptomyces omiyaensis]